MQNIFDANRIKVDLKPLPLKTLSLRPKVLQPLRAITNTSKRDVVDGGKDELKRKREGMPLTLGLWSGTLYIFL